MTTSILSSQKDSLLVISIDSLTQDTIPVSDSLIIGLVDSTTNKRKSAPTDYRLSKDAIDKEITYSAVDSNITDVVNKEINLYDNANVQYEKTTLDADRITINFQENTAQGFAKKNQNGYVIERAKFSDGSSNGTYYEMKYNFNTSKAFVKNLKTQEGEFNILGEKSKFVPAKNDTITNEDKFYNQDAIITTCDLDHPHFGIRTRKMKFIPDKLAVMGPSQLELAGIPTPIILPFGFLPLIKGQSSGLIFPNNYEYNENLGFGLKEIGYYFPINDYVDLKVTGDIYTRGSHAIRLASSYKKRYAYTGGANVGYLNNRTENSEGVVTSNKSFSLGLRHNQDAKAHPYRQIGGSINISGNQYQQRANFDAQSALNNLYRSSFSYNYNFPDSPFKFSLGLEHSQNTQTNLVTVTLPSANLTMRTIQPFQRKNQVGDKKWFEEINLGYKAGIKNFVSTTDTTIFEQETLDNLKTGLSHGADLSFNTRILKYISVSPSVSYNEIYNLKKVVNRFDNTLLFDTIDIDTAQNITRIDTTFGSVIEELQNSFNVYRNINLGVAFNTQLFGTKQFKKGKIRGIRHILKPSVSFNYNPDTKSRYEEVVNTDTRLDYNDPYYYSPFPREPYSVNLSPLSMGINWSLNNTLEAKYYSKKDSTVKNLKLLENWQVRGNYNFAADSMRWSNVSISGNTRIFKGISTFNLTINLTPYELFQGTRDLNQYLTESKKFPLQLKNLSGTFNSGLTIKEIIDIIKGKGDKKPNLNEDRQQTKKKTNELPTITSIIENFRLSHTYRFSVVKDINNRDTFIVNTHTLGLTGNLQLTKNWSLGLGNISYDLQAKKFVYPALSFQRDLHCWSMSFGWYPDSKVYNFFIGVKSSQLSFLKYNYGQNTFGGSFGRG